MRSDRQNPNELRPVFLGPGFAKYAEGSCFVKFGDTHIICSATVEEKVPSSSSIFKPGKESQNTFMLQSIPMLKPQAPNVSSWSLSNGPLLVLNPFRWMGDPNSWLNSKMRAPL
jgi:hypothetical protein